MMADDFERNIVVCCEPMLQALGREVKVDSINWPHMRDGITGPSLRICPWCGHKMPFDYLEEDDVKALEHHRSPATGTTA